MVWGEGHFVDTFWDLAHLLDFLDAQCLSDRSGTMLEWLGLKRLGLSGEESNLPRVCLHLEVGVKLGPAWGAGHLWQWVTLVRHHHLCQELLDVPQVLVVHLGLVGLMSRFCL